MFPDNFQLWASLLYQLGFFSLISCIFDYMMNSNKQAQPGATRPFSKKLPFWGAFLIIILIGSAYKPADRSTKETLLLQLMMDGIGTSHYLVTSIDDDFSHDVYDLYLKRLDGNRRMFLQSDIDRFDGWRDMVDDEIKNRKFEFFQLTESTWIERVNETEQYIEEILAQPFDFTKDESFLLDREEASYAADADARKELWRQSLKYQTLSRIWDAEQEQEKDTTGTKKTFAELEEEAREKVKKNNKNWIDRMKKLETDDLRATYLNAVANSIDPHTSYFPPKDKEDFDIGMSGQLQGIGATLTQRDGYTKVERIVPGSPSARQGELEAGDLIIKVAQGKEEPVDIVDMRLDKAVRLIRGPKGTEVRLTVKKGDGSITVIPIIRDIVILSETYAKSSVLEVEGIEGKVGYIKLPKFYADFNKKNGRSCAKDVESEILKLKKQDVSGIVLDLRNNGGGSLQDVVDMAGLFIKTGPIVQVKSRGGRPYVLADRNPAITYDGPLVVMVNGFSASASEIMAAAMQDYGRAVIIGTGQTFGKGTVQRFFNLDQMVQNQNKDELLGSIKLTTQKFYRINGGTTQLKGVSPDIVLPDVYSQIDLGEREHDHPMGWDLIDPVSYQQWASLGSGIDMIRTKSESRTSQDPFFTKMAANAVRWKERRDRESTSLNYDKYVEQAKKDKAEAKKYEKLAKEIDGFAALTLPEDETAMAGDSAKIALHEDFLKNIRKDSYLREAINVIGDLGVAGGVAGDGK